MEATDRRPVVVGVDGSEQARQALLWAAREARLRDVPLHVVHAWLWPLYHVPLGPPPSGPADAGLQAQAEKVLEDAARQARESEPGLVVETALVTGDVASCLLHAAERAALVVVGDRGLGGFSGLLLGSTGVQVSAHAPCPVVVVRDHVADAPGSAADGVPVRPVVVGVDGSERADVALHAAFAEAQVRGARLVALHAWTFPVAVGVDVAWSYDTEDAEKQAAALLDASLERWTATFPDVRVDRRLVASTAAHALVEASEDAQLVVAGCRGRGALRGLLLGSTSHALIHHAHCPVLVVRHEGHDAATAETGEGAGATSEGSTP
jgi:nucleotide-binding universal stress UspA family protein